MDPNSARQPSGLGSLRPGVIQVAARPILQEYDAFTVDGVAVNPPRIIKPSSNDPPD